MAPKVFEKNRNSTWQSDSGQRLIAGWERSASGTIQDEGQMGSSLDYGLGKVCVAEIEPNFIATLILKVMNNRFDLGYFSILYRTL